MIDLVYYTNDITITGVFMRASVNTGVHICKHLYVRAFVYSSVRVYRRPYIRVSVHHDGRICISSVHDGVRVYIFFCEEKHGGADLRKSPRMQPSVTPKGPSARRRGHIYGGGRIYGRRVITYGGR